METYKKICNEHIIKLIENDFTKETIKFIEFIKNDIYISYEILNTAIDKFNIDIILYLLKNNIYHEGYLINFIKNVFYISDNKKDSDKLTKLLQIFKLFIIIDIKIIIKNIYTSTTLIIHKPHDLFFRQIITFNSYYCLIKKLSDKHLNEFFYNYTKHFLVIFTKMLINMIFLKTKINSDIKNYIVEYLC